MPNEPYVYETVLDMCSVDFTGHWQPGAIFRAMQEAGDGHCHVLDLTFERLRGLGVAWVLSRARLHMEEYPVLDEGRGKLRKATVSRKQALTRRCPNGETRRW